MSASRPFSGAWTNSQARPGSFPVVSTPSPRTFSVTPLSSQPGNADIILGFSTPKRWSPSFPLDTLQASKEIIFCQPWKSGEHPDQPVLLSLGQVNLVLRAAWDKYESILNKKNLSDEEKRVKALARLYAERGEDLFYDDDNNEIEDAGWLNGTAFYHDEKMKFFTHLNHLSIMDNYRLVGVKKTASNMATGIVGDKACSCVLNGRGIVVNYWGKELQIGQNLYLVLIQTRDASGQAGPFQFMPWAGNGSPPASVTGYTDVSGRVWRGGVYKLGAVTRGNHLGVSETRRRTALGIEPGTTAEQINREAVAAPSVDINVAVGDDL
jgi:hypothetical protein